MNFKTTLFLSLFFLALFSRCSSDKDESFVRYVVFPNNAYVALASDNHPFQLQDFGYKQLTDTRAYNNTHQEQLINGSTPGTMKLGFGWKYTDMRLQNGWNNWKHELALPETFSPIDHYYIKPDTEEQHGSLPYVKRHYQLNENLCTSPPAYLHLVLDSINDFSTKRSRNGKSWSVEKITDIHGADVTHHNDWACYNDNLYNFKKSGGIHYDIGAQSCDIDAWIANKGIRSFSQSFEILPEQEDFQHPGKITLQLRSHNDPENPDLGDYSMEIRYSDFHKVVLRVTQSNGQKADLHLSTPH